MICKTIDGFPRYWMNLKSSSFYDREVILMEEKKITEDSGNAEKEKKEVSNPDTRCCYIVDPCGCYVDPCGCYVNSSCCC